MRKFKLAPMKLEELEGRRLFKSVDKKSVRLINCKRTKNKAKEGAEGSKLERGRAGDGVHPNK
jgi:hypothetical protein